MTINTQQKSDYIEDYLKKYFDEFILKDINMINKADLEFTIPYVLLVSTGIDFLGGLAYGFNRGSSCRFRYFINDWLGRINSNYRNRGIYKIIYNSARCGVSHQSIYKKEVESASHIYPRNKHLYHMVDLYGEDRIFIHALQLFDDFIEAQNIFRKEYIKQNINNVYKNLVCMLKKSDKNFPGVINYLKKKGLTFKAEDFILSSPKIKGYDKLTKKIISTDDEEVRPSASPP